MLPLTFRRGDSTWTPFTIRVWVRLEGSFSDGAAMWIGLISSIHIFSVSHPEKSSAWIRSSDCCFLLRGKRLKTLDKSPENSLDVSLAPLLGRVPTIMRQSRFIALRARPLT